MRRRVLAAILAVTGLAIVMFGSPLAVVVGRLLDEGAVLGIERQAVLASRTVPTGFADDQDPVELPPGADGVVFALYDAQGTLISGSGPGRADAITVRALDNEVADTEQGEARIVAVPVAVDERVVGAIRAEQSTVAGDARAHRILGWLAGLAVAVLGVGALIGWVVAGRLARPVLRLRDAAVQLGGGDFAIDVPPSGVVEVDEAGRAMMATADRLGDLITRERMFSADVSHQLRTPLAGLRTAIETELAFPRSDSTEVLHEAIMDLDRLERTITELLAIARTPNTADSPVSLADLLGEIETTWNGPFARAGRPLHIASARFTPAVRGNAATLRHALDVLIDNALRHGGGEVKVDHRVDDDSVTLQITDEGPGFATAPFQPDEAAAAPSGRPSRSLGLPLAKRLIESMPGRITVTRMGPGPQFEVVLQRADRRFGFDSRVS
jgi:signal transduction histidine kinase